MLNLIWLLIFGRTYKVKEKHEHRWKVIQKTEILKYGKISGYLFVIQCEKCGIISHYKIEADDYPSPPPRY